MKAWNTLVRISARKEVRVASNLLAVAFFLLFVVTPTVYVLSYVVTDWDDIKSSVLEGDKATLVWKMDSHDNVTGYEVMVFDSSTSEHLEEYDQSIHKPKVSSTVVTGLPDRAVHFRVRALSSDGLVRDSDGPEPTPLESVSVVDGTLIIEFSKPANDTIGVVQFGANSTAIFRDIPDGAENCSEDLTGYEESITISNRGDRNSTATSFIIQVSKSGNITVLNATTCAPRLTVYGPTNTLAFVFETVAYSFEIAVIVTVIDVVFGFPMAWLIVRKRFPGREALDTLIDLPLAIPTAALGFSTALFWVAATGEAPPLGNVGIVSSPFLLMLLLHIVFTYPYMVRSLAAILEEIDVNYETAAGTLGASRLTVLRTVTLPLFKSGLITGVVLCLARSLSETGGTLIAIQTMGKLEVFQTAPVAIGVWKDARDFNPDLMPAMAFASIVLILASLAFLLVIKLTVGAARFPLPRVFPSLERSVSSKPVKLSFYLLNIGFFALLVLVPSVFIITYLVSVTESALDWDGLWRSLVYSFLIAGCVTLFDLVTGVPLAVLISRGRFRWLSNLLDVLVNIPLVVPTAALGLSLGLFFSDVISFGWAFGLIVLSHIAFTYPLVVRNLSGALDGLDTAYEDAAKTLGAKPLETFRTVVLPLVRPSVLAGSIMAFTRSLGETGATITVLAFASLEPWAKPTPVFIVDLVKAGDNTTAAAACIVLMAVSFFLILAARYTLSREVRREW